MSRPLPAEHYRLVPVAELTEPRSGRCDVITDSWWRVTADRELIFYTRGIRRYYGSPQCNPRREIAERVGEGLYPWPTTVEQLPVVYLPVWGDG